MDYSSGRQGSMDYGSGRQGSMDSHATSDIFKSHFAKHVGHKPRRGSQVSPANGMCCRRAPGHVFGLCIDMCVGLV